MQLRLEKHTFLSNRQSTSETETKITSNLSFRKQNSIMLNYCTEVEMCRERQNNLLSSSLQFGNTHMFIAIVLLI